MTCGKHSDISRYFNPPKTNESRAFLTITNGTSRQNEDDFDPRVKQEVRVNWKTTVGAVLLVSLAAFAWATRSEYGMMHWGEQITDVRTNRFTDETERLTMAGWKAMTPAEITAPVDHTERDIQPENCVVTTKTHEEFEECVDKVLR
jgi:hypothetical protein